MMRPGCFLTALAVFVFSTGAYATTTPGPTVAAPGSECTDGIGVCGQEFAAKAVTVTSVDQYCGLLDDLAYCYSKLDDCDQSWIQTTLIPSIYLEAQNQGVGCKSPFTTPATTQASQSPTLANATPLSTAQPSPTQPATTHTTEPDCGSGIQLCNEDYFSKPSTNIMEEICRNLKELSECYLKLDQCGQNYVREELIPNTYVTARQQGATCEAPTFNSTTPSNPTASSSEPPATTEDPDCGDGIQLCETDYFFKAPTATTMEDVCKFLTELSDCYLKLDECDQSYVRTELIPGTYVQARQQGATCEEPTFSSPVPSSLPSTHASTTPYNPHSSTTEDLAANGTDCQSATTQCVDIYLNQIGDATTEDEVCRLLKELTHCLIELDQCDQDYIRYNMVPSFYTAARNAGPGYFCEPPTFSPSTPPYQPTRPSFTTSFSLPPRPTSFSAHSSTTQKSTTSSTGSDCEAGIQLCVDDYTSKAASATSLADICKLIEELSFCYLKLDSCDQTFVRNDLIPSTYNAVRRQGLTCEPPTFPSSSPGTVSLSSTTHSPTAAPADCSTGIQLCAQSVTSQASNVFTNDPVCRLLNELIECYLKLDQCDQNLIRNQVIPGTYRAYEQQGFNCERLVYETTTKIWKTSPISPSCEYESRQCQDTFEQKVPYASYSEFCELANTYKSCMWNTVDCTEDFIRNQVEGYVGDSLRDCERDSNVRDGTKPLRASAWPVVFSMVAAAGLVYALAGWV